MNPRKLENNEDLLRFLVQTGENLERCQLPKLAELVVQASRLSFGSSSEFLHEAQLALERVRLAQPSQLSRSERQDIDAVISQIKDAFSKIGGA